MTDPADDSWSLATYYLCSVTEQSEADRGKVECCLPRIDELRGGVVERGEDSAGGARSDGLQTDQHCEHLPQNLI